jgi:hypothetical protein
MENSATVKKIKELKDIVKKCLEKQPETRDNDKLLFLKIWGYQNPQLRNSNFSFTMFSEGFLKKKYAEPASISRVRQALQAEHKELRGNLWYLRHREGDDTRNEIGGV